MYRSILMFAALAVVGCSASVPEMKGGPANANVEKAVRQAIAERHKVNADAIDMSKPLSSPPLKLDDLDVIELVMDLEESLLITIPDGELERHGNRITAADLVTIINSVNARPSTPNQRR